ncbi:MAG: Coenzyme F420 hydrogenase/dehydrogenase, beta subunit C-terminal domain [Oscillospiraceae bacterium]|nr:Coenzyme F420 hydrogenase/dehydrogenase, beta subunit C-terminal domain [Oscillospiraceae bacterium]
MKPITIAITAACFSGNKGAAAMLQSSIKQLKERYGERLDILLMSTYPSADRKLIAEMPEKYDNIKVVNTKPEKLLFIAFPLAILYSFLRFVPFLGKLFRMNKIIKAYSQADIVIDEAGISFVDSRGFIMNTYAFVCAAVPMLCGVPVVKYSQALGTFKNGWNKFLAKWILPKIKLICARGQITQDNLAGIGITKNVKLCADGAFSMPDSEYWAEKVDELCKSDSFYGDNVVALSISSVVQGKCEKKGVDYKGCMIKFTDWLNSQGYNVLLIANAAREGSQKPRNNDLMICTEVYEAAQNKDMVRWYPREMSPEEIRELLGRSKCLVASRFHAMIGALEKCTPVLLIGWSHKYKEVLDMFGLGEYAADFSSLELETLKTKFNEFMADNDIIRSKIRENLPEVLESSRNNIRYISEEIDKVAAKKKKVKLLDFNDPEKYIGEHIACRMGYAADESIRANAASGGMITALLCHLLETKQIDGAWVTRSEIKDGKLGYKTFIATTCEQLRESSSSVYMYMPLLKHVDILREFNGKVAVVLVPCQMRAFSAMLEKDTALAEKVALKVGLYCSGSHHENATLVPLRKKKISLENAVRLYYRRGHWRGLSTVVYADGSEKTLSYPKTICAYKNAYFFSRESCMVCQDHYCNSADISFGDIWLKEMKKNPIKHTSCVIRNQKALDMFNSAVDAGAIIAHRIDDTRMVRSQKRALVFKHNLAKAKQEMFAKQGKTITLDTTGKCKWNHRLAWKLGWRNMEFSRDKLAKLEKLPTWFVYYYMCFIRVLLSF